jgi:hypothetical protein
METKKLSTKSYNYYLFYLKHQNKIGTIEIFQVLSTVIYKQLQS